MSEVNGRWARPENYEGEPLTEEETEHFESAGVSPYDECAGCDEYLIDIMRKGPNRYAIEEGMYSRKTGGFVCGACIASDRYYPKGTVVVYDPKEGTVTKWTIYSHFDERWSGPEISSAKDVVSLRARDFEPEGDDEKCPCSMGYHRVDGWRGYYTLEAPEGYIAVNSDSILSGSEDAEELEVFQGAVVKLLWEAGVKAIVAIGSTSNVFSATHDMYAEMTDNEMKMICIIARVSSLKALHRDPARFRNTALGVDSDREGEILERAWTMAGEGATTEQIMGMAREAMSG